MAKRVRYTVAPNYRLWRRSEEERCHIVAEVDSVMQTVILDPLVLCREFYLHNHHGKSATKPLTHQASVDSADLCDECVIASQLSGMEILELGESLEEDAPVVPPDFAHAPPTRQGNRK